MKRILLFICLSVVLIGCKDKFTEEQQANVDINEWIYDNMSMLYYWNEKLPTYRKSYDYPADYFRTLMNKEDRFSNIFDDYQEIINALNGISSSEIGFDFQLYRETAKNDNLLAFVLYVKPGTHAAQQGIQRGDMFRKLNGTQLTIQNYQDLFNTFTDESSEVWVTFANYSYGEFIDLPPTRVRKIANYVENPIYLDTVYQVGNNKLGYLMYNSFVNDPGDESMQYDLELNDAFGRFKQENINYLIVDLRYNRGGLVTSAIHLASMMVPQLTEDKVFSYTQFNKIYTDYFNSNEYKSKYSDDPTVSHFVDKIITNSSQPLEVPINNVGNQLQVIYFLTSSRTASASELVINGLKPYINCVLIGDTTVGKNVGSTLVYDQLNVNNRWAFLPIIMKSFNSEHKSDYNYGFAPNIKKDDDYFNQLGDTDEAMLGTAIAHINGQSQPNYRINSVLPLGSPFSPIRLDDRHHGLVIEIKDSKFLKK